MRRSAHGDRALLHGLQQRRLRFGWSAVDLVGKHQILEDGPRQKAELSPTIVLTELVGARDVGRQ